MVKTNINVCIDIELVEQLRRERQNISGLINELLAARLHNPAWEEKKARDKKKELMIQLEVTENILRQKEAQRLEEIEKTENMATEDKERLKSAIESARKDPERIARVEELRKWAIEEEKRRQNIA